MPPTEQEFLEGDHVDIQMDEQQREIKEAALQPVPGSNLPRQDEMATDVDLSETAALTPDMFEQAPARKSNVYSVRLSEDVVRQAHDYGITIGTDSMSEIIRTALRAVSE